MPIKKEEIVALEEIIIRIHKKIVSKTGEPDTLNYEANLYFAIWKALKKEKRTGDKLDLPIMLLKEIAQRHPFKEGNKRTAFVIAKTILLSRGHLLWLTKERADEYISQVSDTQKKEMSFTEIKSWLVISCEKLTNVKIKKEGKGLKVYFKELTKRKLEKIRRYLNELKNLT